MMFKTLSTTKMGPGNHSLKHKTNETGSVMNPECHDIPWEKNSNNIEIT